MIMQGVWQRKKRKYIPQESRRDFIAHQKNITQVVGAKKYKPKTKAQNNINRGIWYIGSNDDLIRDNRKSKRTKREYQVYGVYEYDGYDGYYGYDWSNGYGYGYGYDGYGDYGSYAHDTYDTYGYNDEYTATYNYPKQREQRVKRVQAKRKSTPCIFYQKGVCLKGKACPFLHVSRGPRGLHGSHGLEDEDDAALLYQVCWNFVSGCCVRGKKCRWLHSIPPSKQKWREDYQTNNNNINNKQKEIKIKNQNQNKKMDNTGPESPDVRPDINIQKFIPRINIYRNKSEFEKAEYLLCCEGLRNNEKILDCHYESLKWKCAFNYLFFGDKNKNLLNKLEEKIINKNMENHKLRMKFFKLLNKNGVKKTIEIYKTQKYSDTETKDNESDNEVIDELKLESKTIGNENKTTGDDKSTENKERGSESEGDDDDDAKQSEIVIQKNANDVNAANDEPCW